ncbi:hypothetical protein Egran_05349 [Elaphomyces granulatus]|uniref:Small ribosomal subunit protein uS4m n=1 Tax=Elaphomyces granulatus TaxID=519963 RepID=A0A232LRX8_9EURO|nr:hypothetical protein Egran_05349 [Elaphomyces granulatus]
MRNRATTPLSKAKIRQSWSKYNLYNLSRLRNPPTISRTFFQQKWTAKSVARAYHGEQVRERQWTRMFSRRIRSVVPMHPAQLAQDDGSLMAAGRGSGLEKRSRSSAGSPPRTPYAQMTFAPLERRLDVAIFRAMFASSARQARQFVVHGAVTVNGKKMKYPGYLLNPGDLFQVDPERVLFATGAPKDKVERREGRLARRAGTEAKSGDDGETATTEDAKNEGSPPVEDTIAEPKDPRETLKSLLSQAKTILSREKEVLPAKRKQEIRGFQRAVRSVLSRSASSTVLTDNLESQFTGLMSALKVKRASTPSADKEATRSAGGAQNASSSHSSPSSSSSSSPPSPSSSSSPSFSPSSSSTAATSTSEAASGISEPLKEAFQKAAHDPSSLDDVDTAELSDTEIEVLRRALQQLRDNPIDSQKPYTTPWRPRDYMSAFAFIPRYLEVNQNICAAVYLRHPVARPGGSEVASPFGESVGTAAYTWYLRRR